MCIFLIIIENKKRAENGTRTRDPDLGKVVLYQLSYFRKNACAKIVLFLGTAKKKYIFLDEKLYFRYFYWVIWLSFLHLRGFLCHYS